MFPKENTLRQSRARVLSQEEIQVKLSQAKKNVQAVLVTSKPFLTLQRACLSHNYFQGEIPVRSSPESITLSSWAALRASSTMALILFTIQDFCFVLLWVFCFLFVFLIRFFVCYVFLLSSCISISHTGLQAL